MLGVTVETAQQHRHYNAGAAVNERYLFTVTAGRSGQASLTDLLRRHVPGCYAAFEEPQIDFRLPRSFRNVERQFRRRFVETHELLGRGRVLNAFETGDDAFLDRIVTKRLARIRRAMARAGCRIYFDVSKYFARGLHRGFLHALGPVGLVRLVRDPILNMRCFVNREKNFRLDNSLPEAPGNLLRMDSAHLSVPELYLWAWCEMYLRFDDMVARGMTTHAVEVRTEDLNDAARMNAALDALELEHTPVEPRAAINTNPSHGLPPTRVTREDIVVFETFLDRLPAAERQRIAYFDSYDPWRVHRLIPTAA